MALPAPVKPNPSDNCPQRKQLLEVKGHEASSGPPSMRVCYWQEWSGTQNHPSTHTHTHSPRCQPGRFLNLHVWMLPDSEASALSWLLWDQVYQELKWRLTSASFLLLCTPAGHKIVITIILFHWHVLCPADGRGLPLTFLLKLETQESQWYNSGSVCDLRTSIACSVNSSLRTWENEICPNSVVRTAKQVTVFSLLLLFYSVPQWIKWCPSKLGREIFFTESTHSNSNLI